MTIEDVVTLVASLAVVAVGSLIGLKAIAALFRRKSYSPSNATDLLRLERPEEWNEVRILHPEWQPDLEAASLHGISLPGINLRDAHLDGVVLTDCNLDGANFDRASLRNADLSRASLSDATFVAADLSGATLDNANLIHARFEGANLEGARVPDEVVVTVSEPLKRNFHEALHQARHSLYKLSPTQFEELVAEVFRSQDFDEVDLTSQTRDGGYDIVLQRADPLLGRQTYLVEVKKYGPDQKVGVSPVRALMGVVIANDAQRGILVTSSSFTERARNLAEGSERLKLIDGAELQEILRAVEPKTSEPDSTTPLHSADDDYRHS